MTKEKVPFNESEFENYLKSNDYAVYNLSIDNYSYKICKAQGNKDYTLLLDLRWVEANNLKKFYFDNNIHVYAIYFPKTNSLIVNSTHAHKKLIDACKSINIYDESEIMKTMLQEIQKEIKSREIFLKDYYKNISAKENEMGYNDMDKIWKMAVFGHDESYDYISDYTFKEKFGYHLVKNYLESPKEMVEQFANEYLKDEKNESTIKRNIYFELKKDEMLPELMNNEIVKKARIINSYQQAELKNAKNFWVEFENGSKEQVENNLFVFDKNIQIGRDISKRFLIDNIVSLSYKRKEYKI
jgi:hypothetical protein